eukprot:2751557-Prymnesium_polylepis.1
MRRIKSLLVAFAWRSMISALMSESITTGATSMRKSMHFQATERTCTGIGGGGGGGGGSSSTFFFFLPFLPDGRPSAGAVAGRDMAA